eukprot:2280719-Rhodomonas_salina.1
MAQRAPSMIGWLATRDCILGNRDLVGDHASGCAGSWALVDQYRTWRSRRTYTPVALRQYRTSRASYLARSGPVFVPGIAPSTMNCKECATTIRRKDWV